MNKNSIILVIVVLGIIGALFLFGASGGTTNQNVAESTSALSAEVDFYDFGEVPIFGGTVSTSFVLKNGGTEDVIVQSGTTSCGCTTAEIDGVGFGMHEDMVRPVVVPAGGEVELSVIYDPLAHGPSGVGLAQRSVFLKTNSRVTPEVEVRIKALVTNNQ